MAGKPLRKSGTRISSPGRSPDVQSSSSITKSRTHGSNGTRTRIPDNQSTLTQMQFGSPIGQSDFDSTDIIPDSEEDGEEEVVSIRARKRKRNVSLPKLDLRKQTTLTQMDFVSLLRYDDPLQLFEDENDDNNDQPNEIDMMQNDIHDSRHDQHQIIPNSSPEPPVRDPPRIEAAQNESPAIKESNQAVSVPRTPKRVRQTPVPSSQTPTATPLSIHSDKGKILDDIPYPTSPTPKPRSKEQQSPISSSEKKSLNTETQTQTQTSPTTKRRITDFNNRWLQLSKEMFIAKSPSPNGSIGSVEGPRLQSKARNEFLESLQRRSGGIPYDLGDETQVAFIEAAVASEQASGSASQKRALNPFVSSNRSFEIPTYDEDRETSEREILESSTNANEMHIETHLEESSDQQWPKHHGPLRSAVQTAPVLPESQISTPGRTSQASMASYTPSIAEIPFNVSEIQMDIPQYSSSSYEQDSLPKSIHCGAMALTEDSLPNNGPLTISQLIPSSLLNSDIPLPPAWSQKNDDPE
jgi:hypothetical protein